MAYLADLDLVDPELVVLVDVLLVDLAGEQHLACRHLRGVSGGSLGGATSSKSTSLVVVALP